jgi:uncharacterized protein (TIGR00730 family)
MKPEEMNVPAKDLPDVHTKHDFRDSFHWRIFRIMSEFVEGFQFLADYKKTVSFFGSARASEGDPHYKEAAALARRLAEDGFTIITGGGPGIMEAANRGAAEVNLDLSVGLNIELMEEQRRNPYVHRGPGFHYFFTRKVILSYAAQAYIFFPGGFGTLDEFYEMVTLIQTRKIEHDIPVPVILVGKDFWEPLIAWMRDNMFEKHRAIDESDLKLYTLVDTVDEAYEVVRKSNPRTMLYDNHE